MDWFDDYCTTFRTERQAYSALRKQYVRQGYKEELAGAMADYDLTETPYCNECGRLMFLIAEIMAWECPHCGYRRPI